MSGSNPSKVDRAMDLLADEATQGLSAAEQAELLSLLPECPELDPGSFGVAAAALDCAMACGDREALPKHLREWVLKAAESSERARLRPGIPAVGPSGASGRGARVGLWVGRAGWLVAAAVLVAAIPAWLNVRTPSSPGAALGMLEASARDLVRIAWTRGPDKTGSAVTGELVWSPARQEGFMVFTGLAANDPSKEQYQLWIFDADRDERYPVHGGVFNAPAGGGRTVVKIEPRLAVPKAFQFVVTVERPGGVWVSDRSRIPALAKIAG